MSEHVASRKTYVGVFLTLLALLALSIWTARFDLGNFNIVLALGISVAKAVLIVLFFMHLLHSSPLIRLVAVGGLVWLGIMLTLTLSDYRTREPGPELPNEAATLDRTTMDGM